MISDWGGVLTSPLDRAIDVWLAADRIDVPHYKSVMRAWIDQAYDASRADRAGLPAEGPRPGTGAPPHRNPIHGLEDGSLVPAEFERLLAAELRTVEGGPVVAEGLIRRMFSAFDPVEPMYAALRAARAGGVATALLSNSWGNEYPRDLFAELFDVVVISSEVGMRKPDAGIFRHAIERLGLQPAECVLIDDIRHNVLAAEAIGMIGLHHTAVDTTLARLADLGLLPPGPPPG